MNSVDIDLLFLCYRHKNAPSAAELLKDPFLSDYDENDLDT